jgi:hypothetical protein
MNDARDAEKIPVSHGALVWSTLFQNSSFGGCRPMSQDSSHFEDRKLKDHKEQTRLVLLVVLPYRLGDATTDTSKKAVRGFLAFPYGVLTLASYIKRYANNLDAVEVLDLNLPFTESPDVVLKKKISDMRPDVVGFSMSYDVSYSWLKSLAEIVKKCDKDIYVVAGGPAITTGYAEILMECEHLDAACYSEAEVGLKNLIEAENIQDAISRDPWITNQNWRKKSSPRRCMMTWITSLTWITRWSISMPIA